MSNMPIIPITIRPQECRAPRLRTLVGWWVPAVLTLAVACSSLPSLDEQQTLVRNGELPLHTVTSRPVLAEWGTPTYSSVQHVQFFPLTSGQWVPNFRVHLGEYPKGWDMSTVAGDGLFVAYADRGEVLGFYEDRLVYRESLPAQDIHALGKQWQREAKFKTRLEGGGAGR